ncbi:30S ribosomal protein S17 [Fimbriiglobus ruber]|uniref:Small ribosomal subunit protein uS17 n=1 Tax=Fimbriiglobus ruber TaxID=1908690 RepID=A0A225DGT2_9BACT|nr:SSU ribosomal protein S17p (S11e) [Fimbriiglobus ruber]
MADVKTTTAPEKGSEHGDGRVVTGIVTSDKSAKTRRVEIDRLVRHPMYGKFVKRRTVCYVHDEKNESHLGDTVEIIESRPLSRTKRWNLVKIVTKAPSRTLSNLEGAVAGSTAAAPAPASPPAAPTQPAAPAAGA